MNECQNCKKGKPHIGKCFSSTGYCKYFPYKMPEIYGQKEDLREPVEEAADQIYHIGFDVHVNLSEADDLNASSESTYQYSYSDVEELMDRIQLEVEKDKRLKVMVTDGFEGMKHRKINSH